MYYGMSGNPDGLGDASVYGSGASSAAEEKRKMDLMIAKSICESRDSSGQVVGTWNETAQKCIQKSWANEKKVCLDHGGKFDDATHACLRGTFRDKEGVVRDIHTYAPVTDAPPPPPATDENKTNWLLYGGIGLAAVGGIFLFLKMRK